MRKLIIPLTALGLFTVLGAAVPRRGAATAQAPLFHSETRLVVVYATVTNARGDLVTNLNESAFTVYENGKPQRIVLFRNDDVPISLGIVIDNSGPLEQLAPRIGEVWAQLKAR